MRKLVKTAITVAEVGDYAEIRILPTINNAWLTRREIGSES